MEGYLFRADVWCKECGEALRGRLKAPDNPEDEKTYDSDEYPKGPIDFAYEESDTPDHCAGGPNCLNALDVGDGIKVGCWLENPLTTDGARYVREAIKDGPTRVTDLWAKWYKENLEQQEGEE